MSVLPTKFKLCGATKQTEPDLVVPVWLYQSNCTSRVGLVVLV